MCLPHVCTYVCLRTGVLHGGSGGFKTGTYSNHGNTSLWSFLPPFLQLDTTSRSARFSLQFHPTLSPLSLLSPARSFTPFATLEFSLWSLKLIPSQTQCYFWPNSTSGPQLCAVLCSTSVCETEEIWLSVFVNGRWACASVCVCLHHNKHKQAAWWQSCLLAYADNEKRVWIYIFVCVAHK